MANVLFTRTSDPNSKPVTDGQLIFDTSGNGKMYLDNGTNRLEMGGALTVDATLSKTSTNPVQNKAVAGVMLDTLSDIGNVTSKGFLTDALAVKQLNTNVNELNNSLGNTGKCDLLLTQEPTNTKSVQLPHSLNDYRSIIVINRAPSGNLTCTSACPIDILKTTNASAKLYVDSTNTNNRTSVYYIDDTHLGVYAIGVTCMVYGVK